MNTIESKTDQTRIAQAYKRIYQLDNLGIMIPLARERVLRVTGLDVCSLYYALSRAVEEGLLEDCVADQILDLERAFQYSLENLPILNDDYDVFFHYELFVAKKLTANLHQETWRRQYGNALLPRYLDDKILVWNKAQKSYQEGTNAAGGVTLDASRFGVQNIAEAVELFEKRTNL